MKKRTQKNKFTVIIPSRGRYRETMELIGLLKAQTHQPKKVVLIECVEGKGYFSKKIIQNILDNRQIEVEYYKTNMLNIAHSRNIGWNRADSGWVVFLDNDVTIGEEFLEEMAEATTVYPQAWAFVAKISPYEKGYLSDYLAYLFNGGPAFEEKSRRVKYFSLMATAVNLEKVKNEGIDFDEELLTGEDSDFFLKIYEKGGETLFLPEIVVKHRFEVISWRKFVERFFYYSASELLVEKKHPQNYTALGYYPKNVFELMLWPILAILYIVRIKSDFPLKYLPATLVSHMVLMVGIYLSPMGREKIKVTIRNILFYWNQNTF